MIDVIQSQLPQILYTAFCVLAVIAAFGVVLIKNPVSSAFSLIMVLLNVAAIFAFQEAYFISAVQVLVYAGAIMVLFVFVIMLLSVDEVIGDFHTNKLFQIIPFGIGGAFFALLAIILTKGTTAQNRGAFTPEAIAQDGGNMRVVSELMFSDYVLPFLVVGMLLSFAIVGAVVLAKRRVD